MVILTRRQPSEEACGMMMSLDRSERVGSHKFAQVSISGDFPWMLYFFDAKLVRNRSHDFFLDVKLFAPHWLYFVALLSFFALRGIPIQAAGKRVAR